MRIHAKTVFASVFLYVATAGLSWAGGKPSSDPASPTAAAKEDVKKDRGQNADAKKVERHWLFDGKAVGKWKPSEFATQGSVEVNNGEIILGVDDAFSWITCND